MLEHDSPHSCAVLGVLYACVLYFCVYTCSAQLSMFHMERRYRNTIITIIIIITRVCQIINKFLQIINKICTKPSIALQCVES